MFFFKKDQTQYVNSSCQTLLSKTFITRNLDSIQIFIAGPFQK